LPQRSSGAVPDRWPAAPHLAHLRAMVGDGQRPRLHPFAARFLSRNEGHFGVDEDTPARYVSPVPSHVWMHPCTLDRQCRGTLIDIWRRLACN
jgi:hypothetical protein